MKKNRLRYIVIMLPIFFFLQCGEGEEQLEFKNIFETEAESTTELDQFLKKEFEEPYGSLIRYKFTNGFLRPDQNATPARLDVVKPIAELIQKAWIAPYNKAADTGVDFLTKNFPAEIVLVGSPIFNGDGTRLLGVADSGVRVTIVESNGFDTTPGADNRAWIARAFRTLHHEFAHIIDQNFNFEFQEYIQISGDDYTSPGSWPSLVEAGGEFGQATINNAITRGMVTAYGTSSVEEDFAEMIAFLITTPEEEFRTTYLIPEDCSTNANGVLNCVARNEGRERIRRKVEIITNYMSEDVGIDISILRDEFLNQTSDD